MKEKKHIIIYKILLEKQSQLFASCIGVLSIIVSLTLEVSFRLDLKHNDGSLKSLNDACKFAKASRVFT